MLKTGVFEPFGGDHTVELVVAQVGGDGHLFQLGFGAADLQRGFVQRHIQRHRGAGAPLGQGVGLHHVVGQHGDLVARHVHGGQAVARHVVHRAAGLQRQAGCGDVDAQHHGAAAQALQRQGVVDFRGLGVVDGVRLHVGQRQLVLDGWGLQRRETSAFGEILEQEALPVELVGRVDGTRTLQQVEWRGLGGA